MKKILWLESCSGIAYIPIVLFIDPNIRVRNRQRIKLEKSLGWRSVYEQLECVVRTIELEIVLWEIQQRPERETERDIRQVLENVWNAVSKQTLTQMAWNT